MSIVSTAPGLVGHATLQPVLTRDFDDEDDLGRVYGRRSLPGHDLGPTTLRFGVERLSDDGLRISVRSITPGLSRPQLVSHRLHFVDRTETRLRLHLVGPDTPEAETEIHVLLPPGVDRDYFHAAVHDDRGGFVAGQTIVFDREGRFVRFPFKRHLVADVRASEMNVEVSDGPEGPAMQCRLILEQPSRQPLFVSWEAMGFEHRLPLALSADGKVATASLPMGDTGLLAPGDWVVIVVDEADRFVAQTLWTLGRAG